MSTDPVVIAKEAEKVLGHPPYLRKTGTEEVFAYNPFLAKRGDMYPWPWPTVTRPVAKTKNEEDEAARLSALMEGVKKLTAKDFTPAGVPKLSEMRRVMGGFVSVEERDKVAELIKTGGRKNR